MRFNGNVPDMSNKQFMSVWDQVVHTATAHPSFCGIKWPWHFYSQMNGTEVHCRVTPSFTYVNTFVHLGGERNYMYENKVSCRLAKENNAISPGLTKKFELESSPPTSRQLHFPLAH